MRRLERKSSTLSAPCPLPQYLRVSAADKSPLVPSNAGIGSRINRVISEILQSSTLKVKPRHADS
jgi:hypothetical protein